MLAIMSERPRMIFDCTEHIRYAIGLRKLRTKESPSAIIVAALSAYLADELREAEKQLGPLDDGPDSTKRRKR